MVTRITGVVRPWRIILFGSRARGGASDDSDYDFYVEVDATGDDELHAANDRIWEALEHRDRSIDVKVQSRGTLEDRRDDPGTIEWDVAREGRVLYADPGAAALSTRSTRVREPGLPASTREWMQLALTDLRHRDELWKLEPGFWAQICWLSQQTAEKHLKALLVSRNIRPERTHDLQKLVEQVERIGLALPGTRSACELLTPHAVSARYGPGLLLQQDDARLATEAADRVIAAVGLHLRV